MRVLWKGSISVPCWLLPGSGVQGVRFGVEGLGGLQGAGLWDARIKKSP